MSKEIKVFETSFSPNPITLGTINQRISEGIMKGIKETFGTDKIAGMDIRCYEKQKGNKVFIKVTRVLSNLEYLEYMYSREIDITPQQSQAREIEVSIDSLLDELVLLTQKKKELEHKIATKARHKMALEKLPTVNEAIKLIKLEISTLSEKKEYLVKEFLI